MAFKRFIQFLISPKLTVISLLFLLVLTFWGTLHQVDHGLFAAQEKFYNSWIILVADFIPFPGTQLVLAVLLINLLGYLINLLLNNHIKFGILIIHLGIFMLLLGGAITHYLAEESYLSLAEGAGSNVSASYHEWELAVWTQQGNVRDVLAADADDLKSGSVVSFEPVGLTVHVENYFKNCKAFGSTPADISRLEPVPLAKEPAENMAGGTFTLQLPSGQKIQVLLFGEDAKPIEGTDYVFALRHKRFSMPLTATLIDFQRAMHPGTQIAKEFSSKVNIETEGVQRPLTISMNKPLRHRGYTLYQASYSETPDGQQTSVFAVTKNYGRLIPYVATSIVTLGMIWHFVAMLIKRARKESAS